MHCPLHPLLSLIISPASVALSLRVTEGTAGNLVANDNKWHRIDYFDYCSIFIQFIVSL